MRSRRFEEKAVLITGAGDGIGRAAAVAFAAEGAAVVVAGRTERALAATVAEIGAAGGAASYVVADVSREEQVAEAVAATVARHGALDVAFNNAGILGRPGPVADLDGDTWRHVFEINVTGVFLCLKHEIAQMRAQGGGTIVNTASNIGAHGRREGLAAYAASKAAVSVLTRNAAREYIGDGVRINAVSPGATDTAMSLRPGESDADRAQRLRDVVPLGRVGRREEVVAAVLWLASPESSFAVGHDLVVDGGVTA
jgi:NAD(P)-dependent dehydrogenase (short-subunit alcohol dehydrogenase family)